MQKLFGLICCLFTLTAMASLPLFSIVGTPAYKASDTFSYKVTNNAIYSLNNISLRYAPDGLTPLAFHQILTGSNACSNPFNLNPGASCTLYYSLNAALLMDNPAIGGPEVCYISGHQIYCSAPDPSQQLNFTLTTPSLIVGNSINGTSPPFSLPFFIQNYDLNNPWIVGPVPAGLSPTQRARYETAACNDSICLLAGALLSAGSPISGLLAQSTDQGTHWVNIDLTSDLTSPAEFVTAACSPNMCIAAGRPPASQAQPLLYQYTSSTWDPVILSANGDISGASCGTDFCVVGGGNNGSPPVSRLYQTTDQGVTWVSARPPATPTNSGIIAVSCSGQSCIALGFAGGASAPFVIQTLDGGATLPWTYINLAPQVDTFFATHNSQLSCASSICVAGGEDISNNAKLIQSSNSGTTWTTVTDFGTLAHTTINAVSCSTSLCVAVGYNSSTNVPVFWQRKLASGSNWTVAPLTLPNHALMTVASCDDNACVIAGYNDTTNAPLVYQTVNAGTSWKSATYVSGAPARVQIYGGQAQ
jgi:hypothetical protein